MDQRILAAGGILGLFIMFGAVATATGVDVPFISGDNGEEANGDNGDDVGFDVPENLQDFSGDEPQQIDDSSFSYNIERNSVQTDGELTVELEGIDTNQDYVFGFVSDGDYIPVKEFESTATGAAQLNYDHKPFEYSIDFDYENNGYQHFVYYENGDLAYSTPIYSGILFHELDTFNHDMESVNTETDSGLFEFDQSVQYSESTEFGTVGGSINDIVELKDGKTTIIDYKIETREYDTDFENMNFVENQGDQTVVTLGNQEDWNTFWDVDDAGWTYGWKTDDRFEVGCGDDNQYVRTFGTDRTIDQVKFIDVQSTDSGGDSPGTLKLDRTAVTENYGENFFAESINEEDGWPRNYIFDVNEQNVSSLGLEVDQSCVPSEFDMEEMVLVLENEVSSSRLEVGDEKIDLPETWEETNTIELTRNGNEVEYEVENETGTVEPESYNVSIVGDNIQHTIDRQEEAVSKIDLESFSVVPSNQRSFMGESNVVDVEGNYQDYRLDFESNPGIQFRSSESEEFSSFLPEGSTDHMEVITNEDGELNFLEFRVEEAEESSMTQSIMSLFR